MILCIIQARFGSNRLHGKVLMDICGKPMLYHVVKRAQKSKLIDKVVIATTDKQEDDKTEMLGKEIGVDVFRGNENDVLDRYYRCAEKFGADIVVRVTGDCPLIDPVIIDKTVTHFVENNFDYVSNAYPIPTYPDGLDTEVFSFKVLKRAWEEAVIPSEREHATSHIWKNENNKFSLGIVKSQTDLSNKRWTVDDKRDLQFVDKIYKYLYHNDSFFFTEDILELLRKNPELENINEGAIRNEGYLKSLEGGKENGKANT